MATTKDSTTLVCLFHEESHAKQVLHDLHAANVPLSSITVIGGDTPTRMQHDSLSEHNIPGRDLEHLKKGLEQGGTIVIVSALTHEVDAVEDIFAKGKAAKIDETVTGERAAVPVAAAPAEGAAIPIVEEQLEVGKRSVDRGGVRVYQRIVETPAEASVSLHEEHVRIERNVVDRVAVPADLAKGDQSIVLTETAEEAVVGKTAHVVEELVLSKEGLDHTERIHDTVRKTEVEVEELPAGGAATPAKTSLNSL